MYRYKRGINLTYDEQGYVYFASILYKKMPAAEQERISELCRECGGAYHRALFDFVTKGKTATAIEMQYGVSKSTLYRAVRRYYKNFIKGQ